MSRLSDAVVTCDGHSYQREAIVHWLRRHETSPKSNVVLPSKVSTLCPKAPPPLS